jgi:hypothetical protein
VAITSLFFLGLLSISFLGYFALPDHWVGFAFAHTAALSIMGFYGCLTGLIASRNGRSYRTAFLVGFLVPIVSGAMSAFLIGAEEGSGYPLTCGGWTALAAGVVIVIVFSLMGRGR